MTGTLRSDVRTSTQSASTLSASKPESMPESAPESAPESTQSAPTQPESATPAGGLSAPRRTEVQREIRDHMLLNFTDWSSDERPDVPVYVRGDGCHVIDHDGRRMIDGLSGLYCTNLGHSYGAEIGAAGAAQLAQLSYTPSWVVTHPSAADLSARIAEKAAPLGLTRVFLTSGGGEAVESAWKLARQWHTANGEPQRRKAIARRVAYHGTHLGALSFTGIPEVRWPFEPLAVPTRHVSNTNAYRHPAGGDEDAFTAALLAEMDDAINFEGPDQVAMIIAEPVQNSGGSFTPPRGYWAGLRALADRYGILLVADEVITAFGRVGEWFGSMRYGARPDMITFAKGATAGHAPLGGVLMSDRVAEPFVTKQMFMHGLTFGGHPLATAIAGAALTIYEREGVLENVRANEGFFEQQLRELDRIPLVGDVRGAGYFWAVELVKDRATKETFEGDDADWLLREVLSERMSALGLLCRLDDRGDPVIQLSPPLVADRELLGRITGILGEALEHASSRWEARRA
jgi:adenosylmethionine-8-amino-7-oxononanoate aminotransferase